MTQNVKTRACLDGSRHGPRVEGVTDTEGRLEISVGDTGLCTFRDEIENSRSSGLRSSASCGGYSNERGQRLVNRSAVTKRSIHKVEEVRIRVLGVEVHQFGSVDD